MENNLEDKWKEVLALAETHIGEKPDIPALLVRSLPRTKNWM
jgi:hypothetical protein